MVVLLGVASKVDPDPAVVKHRVVKRARRDACRRLGVYNVPASAGKGEKQKRETEYQRKCGWVGVSVASVSCFARVLADCTFLS